MGNGSLIQSHKETKKFHIIPWKFFKNVRVSKILLFSGEKQRNLGIPFINLNITNKNKQGRSQDFFGGTLLKFCKKIS